jgi:hypothetical protein
MTAKEKKTEANGRLQITDECNVLLWYARKFPWLTTEQIKHHFYPNISKTNGYILRRINNLVQRGLLNKWKSPHLHYSISEAGVAHLDYWEHKIKNSDSQYVRAIKAHKFAVEYIEPSDFEPRYQDYTHSNVVINTTLALSRTGKFDVVEALDYVKNKKNSLFIRYFPDITALQFGEKAVLRILFEIENAPITLEKMVTKLARNFKDSEGNSDLVDNLQSQESKPVVTFHFFIFTSPQLLNYYIKSIRQILGVSFEGDLPDTQWKAKWEKIYALKRWENDLKINAASFQRWIQKGRIFFGLLPENYDLSKLELVTYDNAKHFPKNPVPSGLGTDNGTKSFDFGNLVR